MTEIVAHSAYLDATRLVCAFIGVLIAWEAALHLTRRALFRESSLDTNAFKWLLLSLGFVVIGFGLVVDRGLYLSAPWQPVKEVIIELGWTLWAAGLGVRAVVRAQRRWAAVAAISLAWVAFFAVSLTTKIGGI